METKTNWLAIIVCAIAGMALGYLWFGILFRDIWMAGNGITMTGDTVMKNGTEIPHSMLPMIVNAFSLLVYGYLMNWLVNKTASFNLQSGATLGGVIGLFSLFGIYTGNRFAGNPTSLSMVNGFYTLLLFIIIGAIVGAWRSK